MPTIEHAGAVLTIDIGAIVANYSQLNERLASGHAAAVVKADGYGLGADRVAPALAAAGCDSFFVAHLDEGLQLRSLLPEPEIMVLNGLVPGAEVEYASHDLIPVLNHPGEIDAWRAFAHGRTARLPAILHIDTGMSRLGLSARELDDLDPDALEGIELRYVMSHLACADTPDHPMNHAQLAAFQAARPRLPPAPASFANSSGIFLGPDYHLELSRPGIALYGGNPLPGQPNPMSQVVSLKGKILQLREIDSAMTVGYGATHSVTPPAKIATVAVGYADGYLRSLSNRASAYIGGTRVPLVGRVSMDLITFDVSDAPAEAVRPGAMIELIGPEHDIDAVAAEAGTIGYEILTNLGHRYHRRYVGESAASC